ncbi:hypothetical protein TI05_01060 [Achromatium sp. WMS3]|nr:hypothetical protein TI05_01060 [Achromatium sp. WMS3]
MQTNYLAASILFMYLISSNVQLAVASDFMLTVDKLHPDMLTLVTHIRSPKLPNSFHPEYSCFSTGEMMAMFIGSVAGGAVANFTLNSGAYTIIGIAAGAALGSLLYRYKF